jgi:Domain of unknown function (DUF4332)
MSKHSLARFVAIALLVLAVIIMVGGVLGSLVFSSRGFGSGWSEGWQGWFTLPVMALSCSTGFGLLLLGAVLLLLVDISRNLSETKVVIQQPAAVEATPPGVVAIETPAALAAAAGVAAGVAAPEAVEPVAAAPVVAAETAVPVGETAETWSPRMAEADDVVVVTQVDDETATVEVGDAAVVGVPVVTADASARMAQVEIAEEEPPVEVVPAPAKKTRKSTAKKAAAAATVAAVAADASTGKETDSSELEASVAALKAAADTVDEPPAETAAEMRLPGAQDAARVSAELSAMKAKEEKAPAKRKRKPAKMGLPVVYIAAVNEADAEKLNEIGIRTTEDLLLRGATRQGRQEIASQTGIDASTILLWVNHVDLYRVRGVGEEFAQLLEAAGVDTVVELARRNPTNLQVKLTEVNEAQDLVRQVPVETQVERWVEEAKTLPRVIKY